MSNLIYPPDPGRAAKYVQANFIAIKVLLEDGSVRDGVPVDVSGGVIVLNNLIPSQYDSIALSYDGNMNLTGVVYKLVGVTVATLTLTYTSVGSPATFYLSNIVRS